MACVKLAEYVLVEILELSTNEFRDARRCGIVGTDVAIFQLRSLKAMLDACDSIPEFPVSEEDLSRGLLSKFYAFPWWCILRCIQNDQVLKGIALRSGLDWSVLPPDDKGFPSQDDLREHGLNSARSLFNNQMVHSFHSHLLCSYFTRIFYLFLQLNIKLINLYFIL